MAKRVPPDERPYRPVQEALVRSVMEHEEAEPDDEPVVVETQTQTNGEFAQTPYEQVPREAALQNLQSSRPTAAPTPTIEKLTREKRVLLTMSEEREIERLVARVADEVSTPVKLSHMLRAYMILLLHAENEITRRARQAAPLHRPPNGDPVALAQFEHSLAQILSAALRDAPPLR